ncbi:hypothetical protein CCP3SC15_2010008 [Gammaproteobacteria bacterium]
MLDLFLCLLWALAIMPAVLAAVMLWAFIETASDFGVRETWRRFNKKLG